jgi:hypothetical protein
LALAGMTFHFPFFFKNKQSAADNGPEFMGLGIVSNNEPFLEKAVQLIFSLNIPDAT